jgi:hypothetical protein
VFFCVTLKRNCRQRGGVISLWQGPRRKWSQWLFFHTNWGFWVSSMSNSSYILKLETENGIFVSPVSRICLVECRYFRFFPPFFTLISFYAINSPFQDMVDSKIRIYIEFGIGIPSLNYEKHNFWKFFCVTLKRNCRQRWGVISGDRPTT